MNPKRLTYKEQKFYLLLMTSAYSATLVFGSYYYVIGVNTLALPLGIAFVSFLVLGLISFYSDRLIPLFRITISIALVSFCIQIFYTGGILSSAVLELMIIPLLAFFYRPIKDRYYFMAISALAVILMMMLTRQGYTKNLIPEESEITHSLMTSMLVFLIVAIFTFLFRRALVVKNKQLGESMMELKGTTQKLVQSEKMASLGVLSAGVAHEINNPLNFIKGGIKALSAELTVNNVKTKNSEKFIQAIQEGADRAAVIVNSLSHFSRQTDQMNEVCNIHDILENCLVMLDHRIKFRVDVQKQFTDQVIELNGNEGKLHQAFINIISNAEQASDDQAVIVLMTEKTKNGIKVRISDNGHGIKKEDLAKIQEPFFTTKPMGKGTGLGLAITFKIIEEHGGKIQVYSELGKGTMFEVVFPLS